MPPTRVTLAAPLSQTECLELLQYSSYVGRVGFNVDGRPMVLPVNYLADEEFLVFCTAEGSLLSEVTGPVAFEVDGVSALYRSGWSVVVRGTVSAVTEPEEIERLRRGQLKSWAAPGPQRWMRVTYEEISGRRLPGN